MRILKTKPPTVLFTNSAPLSFLIMVNLVNHGQPWNTSIDFTGSLGSNSFNLIRKPMNDSEGQFCDHVANNQTLFLENKTV